MKAPNGKLIVGTLEVTYGVAGLLPDTAIEDFANLDAVYEGGTDWDYDSQHTVTTSQGGRIFVDEAGGRWTEDALLAGETANGIAVLITMTETALFVSTEDKIEADAIETARSIDVDFTLEGCEYLIVNYGGEKS